MELRLPGPEQRLSFIAKKSLDLLSPFLTKESKGSIEAYLPIVTSSSASKYGDETHKLLDGLSLGGNQDMDGQDSTVGVSETEGDFKEGKVKGNDKVSHCSEVDDLPVNGQSFDAIHCITVLIESSQGWSLRDIGKVLINVRSEVLGTERFVLSLCFRYTALCFVLLYITSFLT